MKRNALVIKDQDNVATAIQDLTIGQDALVEIGRAHV